MSRTYSILFFPKYLIYLATSSPKYFHTSTSKPFFLPLQPTEKILKLNKKPPPSSKSSSIWPCSVKSTKAIVSSNSHKRPNNTIKNFSLEPKLSTKPTISSSPTPTTSSNSQNKNPISKPSSNRSSNSSCLKSATGKIT